MEPLSPEIKAFLESCLLEKGINSVPEETKQLMISDLAQRLNQWLFTNTFGKLSPVDQIEFGKLLEQGKPTPQKIEQFFRSHLGDIDNIYTEAMLEFKTVYVGK